MQRISCAIVVGLCWALAACSKGSEGPGPDGCGECASPNVCANGQCVPPGGSVPSGNTVLSAGFGSESGQFGVVDAEEAESEAPASLAVNAAGDRVYVLDQVNKRVNVYAGAALERAIPIGSADAKDLAVLEDGSVVVLDRVADELNMYTTNGQNLVSVSISGPGVESVDVADTLYSRPDGVWLEARNFFVKVLNADGGEAEPRRILTGLISPDGQKLVSLELLGDGTLNVVQRPAQGMPRFQNTQLAFERRVSNVLAYDIDSAGRIYIGTLHVWEEGDQVRSRSLLTVLSESLEQLRQVELMTNESGRSISRSLAVAPDGSVFQLGVAQDQLAVRRY
jgi:hypothetical protein